VAYERQASGGNKAWQGNSEVAGRRRRDRAAWDLIDWLMGSPGIKEIHEAKIDIYGRARRDGHAKA
jgi:hypothetical protein